MGRAVFSDGLFVMTEELKKDEPDIRIEFTGMRGRGTTTMALLVGRLLRSLGMTVDFGGYRGSHTQHIRRMSELLNPLDISQHRSVLILDEAHATDRIARTVAEAIAFAAKHGGRVSFEDASQSSLRVNDATGIVARLDIGNSTYGKLHPHDCDLTDGMLASGIESAVRTHLAAAVCEHDFQPTWHLGTPTGKRACTKCFKGET